MEVKPTYRIKYEEQVIPVLIDKMKYQNRMQVPKLEKIVLNQGLGAAVADKKIVDSAVNEMTLIAGQKAVPTFARKSISNFKLREGMPIGARVTLRGTTMYQFLERLINIALPRVRDFRGISDKGFDGRGNYTMGITEHIIFPEVDIDKVNRINGMDITFVTSADTDQEGYILLKELGMPFKTQTN
ncbi:MAG: 50S ribosomal protein L5 [Bacteroidia bacterium]